MPDTYSLISNGTSTSTSSGQSWTSWALGGLTGLSGVAEAANTIWGGIGGIQKIYAGYQEGNKTKMAVGTVMLLLSACSLLPESYGVGKVSESALGGVGGLMGYLADALLGKGAIDAKIVTDTVGFVAPVALGAALKKLAGDELAANDDYAGGLFAVLTSVANAYQNSPTGWVQTLAKAEPELRKAIPLYGFWRDKADMTSFITTYAKALPAYVGGIAAMVIDDAGVSPGLPVGKQVVINGSKKRRKKRRGRR